MKKYKVNVNGTVYEVTVEAQPPPLRRPRPPVVRRCPPLCPARSWMCVFPTAPL